MPQVEMNGDRRFRRVEIALFVLVLVVAGPFLHRMGEQQASRYAFTAALWDDRSLSIDGYEHLIGRDRSVVDGTTLSDKAPGQPIFAVPFYALYRVVGGTPASEQAPSEALGLWWVTLWSATIPLGILGVLVYRWSREFAPATALAATCGLVFGTLLLPYGTMLFGHVLASAIAFGAFMIIRGPAAKGRFLAAGALGGLAVLTEYPMALVVVALAAFAVYRHREEAAWFVAGGVPFAVLLLVYNSVAFGSPFTLSYQWTAFADVTAAPRGPLSMFSHLRASQFVDVLFSQRGLLVATPLIVIAILGAWILGRHHSRAEAVVIGVVVLAMFGILMFWSNPYAGGTGPRYFTPAIPFLGAPLALGWVRWRFPTRLLVGVSVLTMGAAVFTEPQLDSGFDAGLAFWLTWVIRGNFSDSFFTSSCLGAMGVVVHLLIVTAVAGILVRESQAVRPAVLSSDAGTRL